MESLWQMSRLSDAYFLGERSRLHEHLHPGWFVTRGPRGAATKLPIYTPFPIATRHTLQWLKAELFSWESCHTSITTRHTVIKTKLFSWESCFCAKSCKQCITEQKHGNVSTKLQTSSQCWSNVCHAGPVMKSFLFNVLTPSATLAQR